MVLKLTSAGWVVGTERRKRGKTTLDIRAGARSWHRLPRALMPGTESGCRSVVPLKGRGPSGAEKGDLRPDPRAPTP